MFFSWCVLINTVKEFTTMKIKELAQAAYSQQLKNITESWQSDLDIQLNAHNYSAEYDDTRRPRLTLRHLRKLRKMKDIEREDERQHQELLVAMYNLSLIHI